jgi:L-lysine 6-oxidase
VRQFKESLGRVCRQGALFRLFRIDDEHLEGEELTLDHADVLAIEWSVHLANKKAAWYNFAELEGNLLYSAGNSYRQRHVPLRNKDIHGDARKHLIIDPGPRTVSGRNQLKPFDRASAGSYGHVSFPTEPKYGHAVTTLGEVRTDCSGRLVVIGGFGKSGGDMPISSFAGADSWHDDTADGPVRCTVTLKSGKRTAEAWLFFEFDYSANSHHAHLKLRRDKQTPSGQP